MKKEKEESRTFQISGLNGTERSRVKVGGGDLGRKILKSVL